MNKKKIIIVTAACLVIMLALVAVFAARKDESNTLSDESYESTETSYAPNETSSNSEESVSETIGTVYETSAEPDESVTTGSIDTEIKVETDTEVTETAEALDDTPVASVDGLQLLTVSAADVAFPEDGSGDRVDDVLAITVKNVKDKTLQYAKLLLTCEGKEYVFELTTIPAGECVIAFEVSRAKAPEKIPDDVALSYEYLIYFENELTLADEELKLVFENGSMDIKNISGVNITRDFYVYYKNKQGNKYFGGITYRIRVTKDLAPGESISAYASHAVPGESVIMFVQYDS